MSTGSAYADGDIVWVKLGNNWWPGEVIDHEDRLPEGFNQLKKKPYCVVKFFNEDAYEYPKNEKQVHPFQCSKKDEFIKKGLTLYNAKNAFMEKFPDDVKYAESQTKPQKAASSLQFIHDRSSSIVKAVLSDGRLRKSTDYYESGQADVSGGRNSREQSILRRDSVVETNVNKTNLPSIGLSTPVGGVTSTTANTSAACQYRCNICDFTTMRQNVLIMHRKSHSSGAATVARTSCTLPNTKLNSSIIESLTKSGGDCLNTASPRKQLDDQTTPLTSKVSKVLAESQTNSTVEERKTELPNSSKRSRKKLSVSPNTLPKRATRSTPQSELLAESVADTSKETDQSFKSKKEEIIAETPKQTEKIRQRLLADWTDEEKDEEHLSLKIKANKAAQNNSNENNQQTPTTNVKSPAKRRTPTIVPMTALEGAGQTLVVGAVTQSLAENATKAPRIRNIPKKDRQRDFEKSNTDSEEITEKNVKLTSDATDSIKVGNSKAATNLSPSTSSTTELVTLIKLAEKQKKIVQPSVEVSDDNATGTLAGTLSCFDFQEDEDDNESDVLKSIAKYKQKYYSPEKEKSREDKGGKAATTTTERDVELSAEIESLLESSVTVLTDLKTDALPVKGLPIKERGKRIFKSRNRSRLDEEDDVETSAITGKEAQINQETQPKNERKLRDRNTPQASSPLPQVSNGKASDNLGGKLQSQPAPKRRNRKAPNNRIMQEPTDGNDVSVPIIRHSPVELNSCEGATKSDDVIATLVRERGRRSKTATPTSLKASKDEVQNGSSGVGGSGGTGIGGGNGGSRSSSRNFNAPPLTPTDETSSFGISEAGAEFGSPASSLDEERLLTPLETPNESESGNDTECSNEKTSRDDNDDDEIESPQLEALSGDELDVKDTTTITAKERRLNSPKKKPRKQGVSIVEAKVAGRHHEETKMSLKAAVAVAESKSPKRSLHGKMSADSVHEESEKKDGAGNKISKHDSLDTEKEASLKLRHRKTRSTRSQTPIKDEKTLDKAEKDGTIANESMEVRHDQTKSVELEKVALSKAERISPAKKPKDEFGGSHRNETGAANKLFVATVDDAVKNQNNSIEAKSKLQSNNDTILNDPPKEISPCDGEIESPKTSRKKHSQETSQCVGAENKKEPPPVIENLENPINEPVLKKEFFASEGHTKPKAQKIDDFVDTCKKGTTVKLSRHKVKTTVEAIDSLDTPKNHVDNNCKQSDIGELSSRKRHAETNDAASPPKNNKSKRLDTPEPLTSENERKLKYNLSGKQSAPTTLTLSEKKELIEKQQGEQNSNETANSSAPAVPIEITRINVDVANPLSKHPSIVASMLAAAHENANNKQHQQPKAIQGGAYPKQKTISTLKRKLSQDNLLGQNSDNGNNDAVVAHVQSLCPQVKITRKERLIEPVVEAVVVPEKLLATPKKPASHTDDDISKMPIVLGNETVDAASPPSLVSSNLWQTELLQPPPAPLGEQEQRTPPQKRSGLDSRVQKNALRNLTTPSEQQSSSKQGPSHPLPSSGNGRVSPQKPTTQSPSSLVTGGRKQAGSTLSLPVKQQHKFAEALALADSILQPSSKPTKRRSSQQTTPNSNTPTSGTNSSRRLSSAGALDTKTSSLSSSLPKIPKHTLANEARSKSNSPTKMHSGNSSGSGSNSPAPNSARKSHIQHPVEKQQSETASDEVAKASMEPTTSVSSVPASKTQTLITAAAAADDTQTVVEAEQLNSAAKITAVPIQPIPGYAETFMLCMFVDDVYKPINNIPHYLNKDLNQLVPVPPEAYEGILPEFVIEQPASVDSGDVTAAANTNISSSSTMTTPSGKNSSIVCSREGGEIQTEPTGLQLDESVLIGNSDAAAIAIDGDAAESAADNAIVLKLENQHIILDAASFEQLLANPDANTQLLLEDGTEFVLTREVLAALKAQHDDQTAEMLAIPADQQQQQALHDELISTEAGSSAAADLLSVALANPEFYGGEMLQIETTLGMAGCGGDATGLQLLASDGSIVFQAPPLPQAHLTPPITAHTSETNAVLNQTPIMSTLEKPSSGKTGMETSPTASAIADDSDLIVRPNLEDSLAVIGVTTQSSAVPTSLELPITITNPAIAPKVTLAGAHANAADIVQFPPGRSIAAATLAASTSLAKIPRIYDDAACDENNS